jgi:SAM-dependent methyltransferase
MTASKTPADVVAGYTNRLPFIAAEVSAVPAPHALPAVLSNCSHVVELPCGPGHFLASYAAAGSRLTLVDGNQTVLAVAKARALAAGIPPARLSTRCALLAELPHLHDVDLAVLPGGALNQLAAQTDLPDLLAVLHRTLPAGARLVAQVCCQHSDSAQDHAGFLDPTQPDDVWFTDRQWTLPPVGAATDRQRRQHQNRAGLHRVDFAYRTSHGTVLHETTIELVVPSSRALTRALDDVGFTGITLAPGREHGLSELVCTATSGDPA